LCAPPATRTRSASETRRCAKVSGGPPPPPQPPSSVRDAIGGPLGVAESAAPPIAFVTAYTASGSDATTSAWIALAVGAGFALARIVRGQTIQYALTGLIGVGIAALVVSATGRAEDFFLPGFLANGAYALAGLVSVLVRRPAVGIAVGLFRGEGFKMPWRDDPLRVRNYAQLTWIWIGVFALRLAVQLPLYLAGAVVALGTARVAMGMPLTILAGWLTWLGLRAELRGDPLVEDADED
jgi:hypothetical protein